MNSNFHDSPDLTPPTGFSRQGSPWVARDPRVYALFAEAVKLPAGERRDFLQGACSDSGERALLERLLEQDELAEGDRFLDAAISAGVRDCLAIERTMIGKRIGPYEIREWIASGGMGSVYCAVRLDDYNQDVAIKFIRPGYETEKGVRRFEIERQALAELNHANIARILDAGRDDDGRPFCVMELVNGRPIDRYCEEERLATADRIRLFLVVCEAIQHAHQQGVIHLDLKPANILVDETGQVKVVDFGIARLQRPPGLGLTNYETAPELRGSLPYMSREQLEGRGRELDARCDVYGLGVILYKLLASRLPYDFEDRSLPQAIQAVWESAPARLGSLDKKLRGDLETIVAKAMDLDPDRRYENVGELAADLNCYLQGRPILARPVGTFGRLARWYRRNPRLGLALGIACVSLVGATALSTWFALERHEAFQLANRATQDERAARWTAVERQREAERQSALAQQRAERLRRMNFNTQLGRIQQICDVQPALAWEWLNDAERCPPDLLGFAWRHLRRRCSRKQWSISAAHAHVASIEFSCKGHQLVSVGPRLLNIWDSRTGNRLKQRQGAGGPIQWAAFSPDHESFATPFHGNTLRIFKSSTAEVTALLAEHRCPPTCAAFSPRGDLLASADADGTIILWETTSFQRTTTIDAHQGAVTCLAFDSDGQRLVSYGSAERSLKHWTLPNGELSKEMNLPLKKRDRCAISPDGRFLAASQIPGTIVLFDASTAETLTTLMGNGSGAPSPVFSRDAKHLAAAVDRNANGEGFNAVRIWDIRTGMLRLHLPLPGVREVALSAELGKLAAFSGYQGSFSITLWNIAEQTGVIRFRAQETESLNSVAWLSGEDRFMFGDQSGRLRVLGLNAEESPQRAGDLGRTIHSIADSADGRYFAIAAGVSLGLWDVVNNWEFKELLIHDKPILCAAFSPDSRYFACGTRDAQIWIWDQNFEKPFMSTTTNQAVMALAFSPDGKTFVSAGRDRELIFWDTATFKQQASVAGHGGAVTSVAFSPDGKLIASGCRDHLVRLWDNTGRWVTTLAGHAGTVSSVAFSPDGSTLATGGHDATVRIWDLAGASQQIILKGHVGRVTSVAFSEEGDALASCDDQGFARIWLSSAMDLAQLPPIDRPRSPRSAN